MSRREEEWRAEKARELLTDYDGCDGFSAACKKMGRVGNSPHRSDAARMNQRRRTRSATMVGVTGVLKSKPPTETLSPAVKPLRPVALM